MIMWYNRGNNYAGHDVLSIYPPSSIWSAKAVSNDTIDTRTCTKCGESFPATTEYFYAQKDAKGGLQSQCKLCRRKGVRAYQQINKDKIRDYHRTYQQLNKDDLENKKRIYRQANQDKIREYKREYYQANKDKHRIRYRKYRQINRDKLREKDREYQQKNLEKRRINALRYRARKRQLPDTFTEQQWIACLEYHHYCCAVCGKQLRDLLGEVEPHADHWIPLNNENCPGTVATNMVCLCNSCNISKNDTMPDLWLNQKYGTRKANEVLSRIRNYFKSITKPIK